MIFYVFFTADPGQYRTSAFFVYAQIDALLSGIERYERGAGGRRNGGEWICMLYIIKTGMSR